jgi:threonine/homoserine/homoserine lactone efflux protein
MPTSNPKFWAVVGFVVGVVMATGGELNSPLDALLGGVIQALVWFGVSYLIIKRKASKK